MATTDSTNTASADINNGTTTDAIKTGDGATSGHGFRSIRDWEFKRSADDKWLGGIASMVAKNLEVDVVLVRAVFAFAALVTGGFAGLYLIAWLLLPTTTNPVAPLQGFLSSFNQSPVPPAPPAPAPPITPAPAPTAPAPTADQHAPRVDVIVD